MEHSYLGVIAFKYWNTAKQSVEQRGEGKLHIYIRSFLKRGFPETDSHEEDQRGW